MMIKCQMAWIIRRMYYPTLVLATPISGPALICIPQFDSRDMLEPTTLVTPTIKAPRCLQYLKARRVSAVSPEQKQENT